MKLFPLLSLAIMSAHTMSTSSAATSKTIHLATDGPHLEKRPPPPIPIDDCCVTNGGRAPCIIYNCHLKRLQDADLTGFTLDTTLVIAAPRAELAAVANAAHTIT